MNKLNENDFVKMAKKIYIQPSKELLDFLKNEYLDINIALNKLQKIDVSNVEPLIRIAPKIDFLREDEIDKSIYLDKKRALDNAKESNQDFVIIKRILK